MKFPKALSAFKRLHLLLFFLFFFAINSSYAQFTEAQVDSIKTQLDAIQDTQLVHSYIRLSTTRYVSDEDAEKYAISCYALSDSLNYDWRKLKASYVLGSIYHYFRAYEKATKHYKKGLAIALSNQLPKEILKAYYYLPNTYYYLDQMDSALAYNQLYREQATKMNDSMTLAISYAKDGDYYSKSALLDLSLQSYMKSSRMAEHLKDTAEMIRSYGDIALMLAKKGEQEDAIQYYRKAIGIGQVFNNPFTQIPSLINCAILFRKEMQLDSATYLLTRAENILKENDYAGKVSKFIYERSQLSIDVNQAHTMVFQGKFHETAEACEIIQREYMDMMGKEYLGGVKFIQAKAHLGLNQYAKALGYAKEGKAIFQELGNNESLLELLLLLSDIEHARNNSPNAFLYQKRYISYKDSLNEAENKKAYKALFLEYETENKEREITELKNESLQDKIRRNLLITGLILISLLALTVFLFFRIKARQNKELLQQGRELDWIA